jgi:hypothetical protein
LIYAFSASTITSVTVRLSIAALSFTASQRSVDTRIVRVGVLGALGIE